MLFLPEGSQCVVRPTREVMGGHCLNAAADFATSEDILQYIRQLHSFASCKYLPEQVGHQQN